MASSTKIAIIALDSTGAPLGSLAPTWASFRDLADGAARTPQPTIAECGAGTGLYSFAHGLSAGQAFVGVVDFGATASPRYVGVTARYEDFVDPSLSGVGTESVTLAVTADGVARPGVVVNVYAGSVLTAKPTSNSAGTVALMLDAGSYTVKPVLVGFEFTATTIVVTDADTVSPSTIDGTAMASRLVARFGVSGSCSLTAPAFGAKIENITCGEDATLTRVCSGVTAGTTIASVVFRVGSAPARQTVLSVAGSVTDTGADGTGGFSIDLTPASTRAVRAGDSYDYEIEVTLSNAKVYVVESGRIKMRAEVG